jgi:Flp pilus assembly protein TadG
MKRLFRLAAHRAVSFRRSEVGQALVWVAVMLPLFLSVIGLSIDAGTLFDVRRELQNVADSAARAGAMQIDQTAYRASSGTTVVLDPATARQAAAQYVSRRGAGFAATIEVEPRSVVVQVSQSVPTSFLRLVGIGTMRITATAPATPRFGIQRENP